MVTTTSFELFSSGDDSVLEKLEWHIYLIDTGKARFGRRTFHEPNPIRWIKYVQSSVFKSIRNAYFKSERLSVLPALPGRIFAFGAILERQLTQTANFLCAQPNAY